MTKKEWLREKVFVDLYGRPYNLSDVPMTYMTRSEAYKKQRFDDKKIKNASSSIDKGFGLRSIKDETSAYSHSSDITEKSIETAGRTVKSILSTSSKSKIVDPIRSNKKHYSEINPLDEFTSEQKTKLLKSIDAYARKLDKRVAEQFGACTKR